MKTTTLAAAAAILLAASGAALYGVIPALAQPGTDPLGNGVVTMADAKARGDAMWTKMDVNKDGVLNAADREAKMMQVFDTFDANHDGAVTRAEFVEHSKTMMDDKSGRVGRPGGMGMMMGRGGAMMHKMAAMADTNRDKSISRAEFDAAGKAMFDKADADHDGKLTAAERRKGWAGMRKAHGRHGGHGDHRMPGGDMGDMPPPPGA